MPFALEFIAHTEVTKSLLKSFTSVKDQHFEIAQIINLGIIVDFRYSSHPQILVVIFISYKHSYWPDLRYP